MNVYDLKLAKQKIQDYCAYQERCHQEVSNKLKSWGLIPDAIDMLLGELMQHNFLNEERYARSFARGKFRIKKWGRIKIRLELKKKGVYSKCIDFAMQEIDDNDYLDTLKELLKKKSRLINEPNFFKKKTKLKRYLVSRGFEFDLILLAMEDISNQH